MTSGTEGLGWVRDQLPERKRVVARKMGGASFLLLERDTGVSFQMWSVFCLIYSLYIQYALLFCNNFGFMKKKCSQQSFHVAPRWPPPSVSSGDRLACDR